MWWRIVWLPLWGGLLWRLQGNIRYMISLLNVTLQTSDDTHVCSMIVLRMMSFWHSLQYSCTFSCKLLSTVVNLLAYLRRLSICILHYNDLFLLPPVCPDCSSLIFWFQSGKSLKLRYWHNELSELIFPESHLSFQLLESATLKLDYFIYAW